MPPHSALATAKLRRAHRKSRNGCWECKRRHIKCDENRPACTNCVIGERTCSFPPSKAPPTTSTVQTPVVVPTPSSIQSHSELSRSPTSTVQTPAVVPTSSSIQSHSELSRSPSQDPMRNTSGSRAHSPANSISSTNALHHPRTAPTPSCSSSCSSLLRQVGTKTPTPAILSPFTESPLSPSLPDSFPTPVYTSNHLMLLHRVRSFLPFTQSLSDAVVDMAVEWAEEAPYVMDQLLAISAEYFALGPSETAASFRRMATELQTRALTYINKDSHEISDPDKRDLTRILFSSLLSIHLLYDSLTHHRTSFHIFIERFADSAHLHRGVRTITSSFHTTLLDSPLSPGFVNVRNASKSGNAGDECGELLKLIQNSDLGVVALDACTKAAHTLQWAFNVHCNLPQDGNVHAATAFPVLLTAEYVEAVRKHYPEALLVLAHYGVLLHRSRQVWVIGDSGAFLIKLIANYLGGFWQSFMRWPLDELARDQG